VSTFKSVVAATDLGEGSIAPARFAASIARDYRITLCVIHVYALPTIVYGAYPSFTQVKHPVGLRDAAEQALREWSARLSLDVDADLIARGGPIAETILDEVATRNADLLVIGTHDHGLSAPIIGSTAQKLIRAAPVAVLTVRPQRAKGAVR
jgi:nucleotide-binding universal stress UspA family protein